MIGNDDDGLPLYVGNLVGNKSCKLVLPLFLLKGWHCQSSVYILSPILLSLDKLNNSGYFVVGNGWFGIPLASLNGSKPDIVLSNTPPKLTSIFAHMYFAWKLFAWQNGLEQS